MFGGVAFMMRRVIKKVASKRSLDMPNKEGGRGQKSFRQSSSEPGNIVHRRHYPVNKNDRWVEVETSEKKYMKSGAVASKVTGKSLRTVSIKVQLPPGFLEHSVRRFDVPEDKNVGVVQDMLSKRFGVERGQWKLYGNTKEGSKLLKRDEPIKNYDMEETTLYFYPDY